MSHTTDWSNTETEAEIKRRLKRIRKGCGLWSKRDEELLRSGRYILSESDTTSEESDHELESHKGGDKAHTEVKDNQDGETKPEQGTLTSSSYRQAASNKASLAKEWETYPGSKRTPRHDNYNNSSEENTGNSSWTSDARHIFNKGKETLGDNGTVDSDHEGSSSTRKEVWCKALKTTGGNCGPSADQFLTCTDSDGSDEARAIEGVLEVFESEKLGQGKYGKSANSGSTDNVEDETRPTDDAPQASQLHTNTRDMVMPSLGTPYDTNQLSSSESDFSDEVRPKNSSPSSSARTRVFQRYSNINMADAEASARHRNTTATRARPLNTGNDVNIEDTSVRVQNTRTTRLPNNNDLNTMGTSATPYNTTTSAWTITSERPNIGIIDTEENVARSQPMKSTSTKSSERTPTVVNEDEHELGDEHGHTSDNNVFNSNLSSLSQQVSYMTSHDPKTSTSLRQHRNTRESQVQIPFIISESGHIYPVKQPVEYRRKKRQLYLPMTMTPDEDLSTIQQSEGQFQVPHPGETVHRPWYNFTFQESDQSNDQTITSHRNQWHSEKSHTDSCQDALEQINPDESKQEQNYSGQDSRAIRQQRTSRNLWQSEQLKHSQSHEIHTEQVQTTQTAATAAICSTGQQNGVSHVELNITAMSNVNSLDTTDQTSPTVDDFLYLTIPNGVLLHEEDAIGSFSAMDQHLESYIMEESNWLKDTESASTQNIYLDELIDPK